MKTVVIASRLTHSPARRSFLCIQGLLAEQRITVAALFIPRAVFYWRKCVDRINQISLSTCHMYRNLAQISQRIDMHFSSFSKTFVTHVLTPKQSEISKTQGSFPDNAHYRQHLAAMDDMGAQFAASKFTAERPDVLIRSEPLERVERYNRMMTIIAEEKIKRQLPMNAASGFPPLPQQDSKKSPANALQQQHFSQSLQVIAQSNRGSWPTRVWGQSSTASRVGLPPAKAEYVFPRGFKTDQPVLAGQINENERLNPLPAQTTIHRLAKPSAVNQANTFQPEVSVAMALVWGKSASAQDAGISANTLKAQAASPAKSVQDYEGAAGSESRVVEQLMPQTRQALINELFSGGNLDRLADDVMRRIDKRLRIERERHGY